MKLKKFLLKCLAAAHKWLSSEPGDIHSKSLCNIVTWGFLEISGGVVSGMVIAPTIYADLMPNKYIAVVGAIAILSFVNIIFLLVKELLSIWNIKTVMIYYYPLFALLSFPLTILLLSGFWSINKNKFNEFFKD